MKKDVWAAGDFYEPYVGRRADAVPDSSIALIARAWAVKGRAG